MAGTEYVGWLVFRPALEAGFFEQPGLPGFSGDVNVYLIHNLEHGYVIFRYNCSLATDCEALKSDIRAVMAVAGGARLIAFPLETPGFPVVMTS